MKYILTVLWCLFCACPVWAHEPMLLDARRATPGLRLELSRLQQLTAQASPTYRLRASGFPQGTKLLLWSKEFDHSFHQIASMFQADNSGIVAANGRPRRLDEMSFSSPETYPHGALWEVALVSLDRKLQAYAKAIPYPIAAKAGECTVSLALVSHRGEKFLASGDGFLPLEEVIAETQYSGIVRTKRLRISPNGELPPQVLIHAATGNDRRAKYVVKSHSCEVAVDYQWGEPAIRRN